MQRVRGKNGNKQIIIRGHHRQQVRGNKWTARQDSYPQIKKWRENPQIATRYSRLREAHRRHHSRKRSRGKFWRKILSHRGEAQKNGKESAVVWATVSSWKEGAYRGYLEVGARKGKHETRECGPQRSQKQGGSLLKNDRAYQELVGRTKIKILKGCPREYQEDLSLGKLKEAHQWQPQDQGSVDRKAESWAGWEGKGSGTSASRKFSEQAQAIIWRSVWIDWEDQEAEQGSIISCTFVLIQNESLKKKVEEQTK